MRSPWNAVARRIFFEILKETRSGRLELVCPDRTCRFGDERDGLQATIAVHDERFFRRAVYGGDIGIGESYMDGDWSSPDLVAVMRLAVRNMSALGKLSSPVSLLARTAERLRHLLRSNTVAGSRRNIHEHYDLSNEFFALFLDRNRLYSSAYYRTPEDSLERAQLQKMERVCRKLRLAPSDHLLEIGTGWGAFASYAASRYGCRVTTTTISREQYEHAADVFGKLGPAGDRIELLLEDYRNLGGRYDKIAAIEMFEAVGLEHYPDFFHVCDRLLADDGAMLLQTIVMNEKDFNSYRKERDWIQKYIFPGGELASVLEILRVTARETELSLFHAEDIGAHYARTLAEWRSRFLDSLPAVRALGFDDRFIRMWDFYLAYCGAAFRERHIGDMQLLLTRRHSRAALYNEPHEGVRAAARRPAAPEPAFSGRA